MPMTVLWFVTWLIANNVGGPEPLTINPVNAAATLILAVGLDLARAGGLPQRAGLPVRHLREVFACMLVMVG